MMHRIATNVKSSKTSHFWSYTEAVYIVSSLGFRTEPSLMTCVISRLNYTLQSCNLDQTVVERGVYPDVCSSNNTSLHTVGLTAQLQYLLTLLPITHCSVAAYAVLSVKANWTRSSNPIYSSRGIRW